MQPAKSKGQSLRSSSFSHTMNRVIPDWPILSHPYAGTAGCMLGVGSILISQVMVMYFSFWYRIILLVIGIALVMIFGTHFCFYMGQQLTALDATSMRRQPHAWERNSEWMVEKTLGLEFINERVYKDPVIYVLNRLPAKSFQNMCLTTLLRKQGEYKIVTHDPSHVYGTDSLPAQVMRTLPLLLISSTKAYEEFMQKGKEALGKGCSLVVFPEGDKDPSGRVWSRLTSFHTGVFDLAFQESIPIVPIVMDGTRCPKGTVLSASSCKYVPLRVEMLEAIFSTKSNGLKSKELLKAHVFQIMQDSLDRFALTLR